MSGGTVRAEGSNLSVDSRRARGGPADAVAVPITAMTTHAGRTPTRVGRRRAGARATTVPKMIARKVSISMKPFARGRSRSRSISGRMPYLPGPKNALCAPIKKRTTYARRQRAVLRVNVKAKSAERHDGDLGDLAENDDKALAELIRQIAGKTREGKKGRREDEHRQPLIVLADDLALFRFDGGDREEQDDLLEEVVVERPQRIG